MSWNSIQITFHVVKDDCSRPTLFPQKKYENKSDQWVVSWFYFYSIHWHVTSAMDMQQRIRVCHKIDDLLEQMKRVAIEFRRTFTYEPTTACIPNGRRPRRGWRRSKYICSIQSGEQREQLLFTNTNVEVLTENVYFVFYCHPFGRPRRVASRHSECYDVDIGNGYVVTVGGQRNANGNIRGTKNSKTLFGRNMVFMCGTHRSEMGSIEWKQSICAMVRITAARIGN